MNLVPLIQNSSISLLSFSSPLENYPELKKETKTAVVSYEYIPLALKRLCHRLGLDGNQPTNLEKREISKIETAEEAKEMLRTVLVKINTLMESTLTDTLSSEIKELDQEVIQIEKRLQKIAEQKKLTSEELSEVNKELDIGKELHKVLWSMNDYLSFQQHYGDIDKKLDHSLIKVNDSIFSELCGFSPSALSGVKESVESMQLLVKLTSSLLKKESPFTPELVSQLHNGVVSTSLACSDWLKDMAVKFDDVVLSVERLWKEALERKGTDLETFARLKEAGDFLLSMKEMLKQLKHELPKLMKTVEMCQKKLSSSHKLKKQERSSLDHMRTELSVLSNALQEMEGKNGVSKMLKDLDKVVQENGIEKTVDQFSRRVDESLEKKEVFSLLDDYKKLVGSEEEKLDAYLRLKQQLNGVLSLPHVDKELREHMETFCEKEEKRLIKQTGEEIAFTELMHAKMIKEGQPKPNFLSRTLSYLNPENWSEKAKRWGYGIGMGLQLFEQAIGIYHKVQMRPFVTQEKRNEFEKEASVLGTYLTDKYEQLKEGTVLNTLTKKYPDMRKTIPDIIHHFPNQPNKEQIKVITESYLSYKEQCLLHREKAVDPIHWVELTEPMSTSKTPQISVKLIAPPQEESTKEKTESLAPSLISSTGSFFSSFISKPGETSVTTEERIFHSQEKSLEQLQESSQSLNQINSELHQTGLLKEPPHVSSPLQELKQETALLLESLRDTMLVRPETCSPLPEWMEWSQKVEKQCFEVKMLEKQVEEKMKTYLIEQGPTGEESLDVFGNKHKNLVKQARLVEAMELPGIHVPLPRGVSTGQVTQFLKAVAPEIFEKWKQLGVLYEKFEDKKVFMENQEAVSLLSSIQQGIEEAFAKVALDEKAFDHLELSQEIQQWLADVIKKDNYLMVRSTGAEDSKTSANAGGNISVAYVKPTRASLAEAMGKVVSSYFGISSLKNRINADTNPFKEELRLAVTAQELIGEPLGGSKTVSDVPISLVLFSNEPLFIGGEEFRVMRISATYGHGEGVVGNQGIATDTILILRSVAHPDELYILYDNQEKPERLSPVKINDHVMLKKTANRPGMMHRPVLDQEKLLRLFQWGVLGEKFFSDKATDMEIVIKGDTIYPVQARPVNRLPLLPTYLDLRKIEKLPQSPLSKTITAEMIVPGKASVVEITQPEEILIAETLEKAEGLFRKGQHKLVIVGQQEPANSHPVVNFSSLGMPCLFAKDLHAVQELVKDINEKQPLAACIQSATLSLWNGEIGPIGDFTSEGFVVHPAKISISLPLTKPVPQFIGVVSEVPQEINSLLSKIGTATNKKAAHKQLKVLQNHPWIHDFQEKITTLEKKVSENPFLKKAIGPIIETAKALNSNINQAFEQVNAILEHPQKDQNLELLFHLKALNNLLKSPSGMGVSKHSVATFESVFQAADALISYQKKLTHPAIFADVLMDGTQSPVENTFNDWNNFLLRLEPLAKKTLDGKKTGLSSSDVSTFKNTLAKLREGNALPLFMTFYLGETEDPVETVLRINQMLPNSDKSLIEEMTKQKKEIAGMKNEMGQFGDPKAFPVLFKRLRLLAEAFSPDKIPWLRRNQWESTSPITRSLALKTMNELIDVYDSAIKSMKASQQFNNDIEKTQKFKEMLGPYFTLLKEWSKEVNWDRLKISQEWKPNVVNYLEKMEKILDKLSDTNPEQLESSDDFSVSAAKLGSGAHFGNHLPETLEDTFTLIHQNLLSCTSMNMQELLPLDRVLNSRLPKILKVGLEKIKNLQEFAAFQPQQTGIDINRAGITIHYSVPLRAHSSKFFIHYDGKTGKQTMQSLFLGINEGGRWNYGLERAILLNDLGIIPLEPMSKISMSELSYSQDITKEENIEKAYLECFLFIEETMNNLSDDDFTDEFIETKNNHTDDMNTLILNNKNTPLFKFKIINNLIKKGEYIHEAILFAEEKIKDPDFYIKSKVLELMSQLIQMGHGLKEIHKLVREVIKEPNLYIQVKAMKLLGGLVEKGFGFEEANTIAQKGLLTPIKDMENIEILGPDEDIQENAVKLYAKLIKKNFKTNEIISTAINGFNHTNKKIQITSIKLWSELVANKSGLNEALPIVIKGITSGDLSLQFESLKLYVQLLKQGKGIDEVKKSVTLGLKGGSLLLATYFAAKIKKNIFKALKK